jgi:photosystem II stability/assembly factor-like uncharacterized protein
MINVWAAQNTHKAAQRTTTTAAWQPLGPLNVPVNNNGIGRINCIVIDPQDTSKIYVGAACGGVFISHDAGATWTSSSDNFPSMSVADVAVNPQHTDTIYAATGDGYGYETGAYNIFWGGLYTAGVMKSTDGGNTWNTTGLSYLQSSNDIIQKLLIHPNKTDILLAATRTGIKRTTDGGATWTTVETGHVYSMVFRPGRPDTVYALNGANLRVSYNAGATWSTLFGGISTGTDRATIAVSPVAPGAIWVLDASNMLRWSHDGGHTFNYVTSPRDTAQFYGYYDRVLAIDPHDSNLVYANGMIMARSTDGCLDWNKVDPYYAVHVDNHALAINPQHPETIYSGNDGGIAVTRDGGNSWTNISNGLMISQIYHITSSRQNPSIILCGLQDNGTVRYDGTGWKWVTGGDGMACAISPYDDNVQISSYQNGNFYISGDQGNVFAYLSITSETGAWTSPVVFDPNNHNTIYFGYKNIYASYDGGVNFTNLTGTSPFTGGATLMAIAPSNSLVLYAGDLGSLIRTTDGGTTWHSATGNLPVNLVGITDVAVDYNNPDKVYVTTSGYTAGKKVYMSTNGGTTWTSISGTLPNLPVNCIAVDSSSPGGLFVGTDMGVYYQDSSSGGWSLYGTGLPNVMVNDIDINYTDYNIKAGTYGRGAWQAQLKNYRPASVTMVKTSPVKVDVFPNPAKDSWKIMFAKQPANYTLKVSDLQGRILQTQQNSNMVDASKLPAGVYNIDISDGSTQYHAKAIKE